MLPPGLACLSQKRHQIGMLLDLWAEPEMISSDSDLYRVHPDWCLHAKGHPRTEEHNQPILDLSRPEVQAYVIDAITGALQRGNVDYVKWNMSRNMTEYYSAAAGSDQQTEVQHRYMLGLYHVMEETSSRFPQVQFESCSGGGGRFDGGMLYYMPQAWAACSARWASSGTACLRASLRCQTHRA